MLPLITVFVSGAFAVAVAMQYARKRRPSQLAWAIGLVLFTVAAFMGYLARSGDLSEANLRRAVVYGSAMGSFAVEKFSIDRLLEITPDDIRRRVADFHRLVVFERDIE